MYKLPSFCSYFGYLVGMKRSSAHTKLRELSIFICFLSFHSGESEGGGKSRNTIIFFGQCLPLTSFEARIRTSLVISPLSGWCCMRYPTHLTHTPQLKLVFGMLPSSPHPVVGTTETRGMQPRFEFALLLY